MENFLSSEMISMVRDKFHAVDFDNYLGKRLFFENSGGSLRLKSVNEKEAKIASLPDCAIRNHKTAKELFRIQENGLKDIRTLLNAKDGSILTGYTASMLMFDMVKTVIENIPGSNVVTSSIEHPSVYDSMEYYSKKMQKELRVAKANKITGGIDVKTVIDLIDADTCLLNIMAASNITGANMDIEAIIKEARTINPDIYIIIDCVQFAPHGVIDVEALKIDALNIAPYKFFGNRGFAIGYVSDRMSILPHHKLKAKDENDWELGSATPADYAAISEVVNYICWVGRNTVSKSSDDRREALVAGMKAIKNHEQALLKVLLDGTDVVGGIRSMDGVSVHFDTEDLSKRSLILALTFENISCQDAVKKYEEKGIVVYERVATSAYSKRILESFDLDGVVRVSPLHCYNSKDMVTFLDATREILSELS